MSLREQAAAGATWTATSSVIVAGTQFVQLAVLARLLDPEAFGLMAMIWVVLGFAHTYADMGISGAIIHRQDTTRDQLSSLYWLNIFAGLIVFLSLLAATPLIVMLYDEPRLSELVPWAALVIILLVPGQQFQVLLEKELRFRLLAAVEISAVLLGAMVAIASALAGQGVFALIWGHVAVAGWRTTGLLAIGWREWRPRFHFSSRDLRGYLSFGFFQMGERSINYVVERIDQLMIGALLGATALGYYNIAFNLVVLPVSRINPIVTRVAFPLFARIQHDTQRLKRGYLSIQRILSLVNFPILFGFASLAPVFIPLILGEQWLPSVPLVQILAFVALLRSTGNPVGSLLLAKGRADLGFYWNLSVFFVQIPTIYAGARLAGAPGVAVGLLAMTFLYFWLSYLFLIRPILGPCLGECLRSLVPALVTAGIMSVAMGLTVFLVATPTLPVFIAQVVSAIVIYAGLNWLLYRQHSRELLRLVWHRSNPG